MSTVRPTRMSWVERGVPVLLAALAVGLWMLHADAWSLGRRSPVLGFDAAQYAVAARELARHGRLATTFALPLELEHRGSPPWPLAVVQPGLVLVEALVERVVPARIALGSGALELSEPHQREPLMLAVPLGCFLAIASWLPWLVLRILERHAPGLSAGERAAAAALVGVGFVLDPEAQHYAAGGLTELPFTLGILLAAGGLALGWAGRRPLRFGLVLGLAGAFRGNMLWLAPIFAIAAAHPGGTRGRARTAATVLLGFVLVLAPWWIYKAILFGHPGWDLSALGIWDGVGGRTWFSLTHLPRLPDLPSGDAALAGLAGKLGRNLGQLVPALLSGLRGVLLGALLTWILLVRSHPLRPAAIALVAAAALGLLVASLGASWLRYLFPARVPLEAAGLLAAFALIRRIPPAALPPAAARVIRGAVAAGVLAWGVQQTARGNDEARAVAASRGLPGVDTLRDLGARIDRELPPGEPLMSNLGPTLAWYASRPVVHLALRPGDLDACRRQLEFRHVVLAFRDSTRAWSGWGEIVARPVPATLRPEWNVHAVRAWETAEGFRVVWLELGPRSAGRAGGPPSPPRS